MSLSLKHHILLIFHIKTNIQAIYDLYVVREMELYFLLCKIFIIGNVSKTNLFIL